jgi:pimeloyl-ACP methyl ester carboxylesterase
MSLPYKKIFIFLIIISLFAWLTGSLYLLSQSKNLIYQTNQSKNLEYTVDVYSEFLTLKTGETIELLITKPKITRPKNIDSQIILYFHGNAGRLPINIQQLAKFGTVISPAYPGYSKSTGHSSTEKIHDTIQATLDWLESQDFDPQKVTIFGHSLGGSAAIYAATKYPQAKQLILVNTFYSIQRQCQLEYKILCIFTGSIHNSANIAPNINPQIPLHHFHNPEDELIPYSDGQELFELMPNNKKVFKDIDGTHGDIDATWIMEQTQKNSKT